MGLLMKKNGNKYLNITLTDSNNDVGMESKIKLKR